MPQVLRQRHTEKQLQKLTPQQVLRVRLLELSVMDLSARIERELMENMALSDERKHEGNEAERYENEGYENEGYEDEGYENEGTEEYGETFDWSGDDGGYADYSEDEDRYDVEVGQTASFMDGLLAQITDYDVTPQEERLLRYLIGSLNDKGYLERPLRDMVDDLAIYAGIDVSEKKLESVLGILQQFDPPGIGARTLQECLQLQLKRLREQGTGNKEQVTELAERIVGKHMNQMADREKLRKAMGVNGDNLDEALALISKLNPTPGLALNESESDRVATTVPDIIIETNRNGVINFVVNNQDIPELGVDAEYLTQMSKYQAMQMKLTRRQKKELSYLKDKVETAKTFINAVKQREYTLYKTAEAIVKLQHDYILTQDENDLKPMMLSDVAQAAGFDISTISRVKNSKYASIDGTLHPLSDFFMRVRNNAQGERIAGNEVNTKVQLLIEGEDEKHPLDDQQLADKLKTQGLNISRRTVAKYRKELGYPIASKRRAKV